MDNTQKIELIKKLFDSIVEPKLKWNINTLGLLKKVDINENNKLIIDLNLVVEDESIRTAFHNELKNQLAKLHDGEIELNIGIAGVSNSGISGIKKVIMVASGKGGVGKSTVSVNLASTLQKQGFKVGLIDADIYGPSIPIMLGCEDKKPAVLQNEYLEPIEVHGLKFISIGSLVEKSKAVNWRGQMVSGTILQFIENTAWEDLDFLVIDMPPGTGDIHLTLASKVKPDGVIVVATPQEVVLEDVRRSIDLLKKENFPIIGIVENMSYFICEQCGHENHHFHRSEQNIDGISLVAKFPLLKEVSKCADEGTPYVLKEKDSNITKEYENLSQKVKSFTNMI
jgi:ATP-binding protein involved in chromosome partitioning